MTNPVIVVSNADAWAEVRVMLSENFTPIPGNNFVTIYFVIDNVSPVTMSDELFDSIKATFWETITLHHCFGELTWQTLL